MCTLSDEEISHAVRDNNAYVDYYPPNSVLWFPAKVVILAPL